MLVHGPRTRLQPCSHSLHTLWRTSFGRLISSIATMEPSDATTDTMGSFVSTKQCPGAFRQVKRVCLPWLSHAQPCWRFFWMWRTICDLCFVATFGFTGNTFRATQVPARVHAQRKRKHTPLRLSTPLTRCLSQPLDLSPSKLQPLSRLNLLGPTATPLPVKRVWV